MVGDLVDPGSVFYRQSWLILNRVFNATGLILGKRPTFGLFLIIFCLLLIIVINTSNIFKMFSISQVLILIFIVTKSLSQSSPDACRNPNGDVGSCINIRQCTALMNILQSRPLDPQNVRFLQESRCGFEGRDPKVCCVGQHQSVGPDSDQNGETNNGSIASRADLLPDDCGRDLSLRILGGERAEIDEFPWMVLLEYQKPMMWNRMNFNQWLRLSDTILVWRRLDRDRQRVLVEELESLMVSIIFEDGWHPRNSIRFEVEVIPERVTILSPVSLSAFPMPWYSCEKCKTPASIELVKGEIYIPSDSHVEGPPKVWLRTIGTQTDGSDSSYTSCPLISRRKAFENSLDWVHKLVESPSLFGVVFDIDGCFNCHNPYHSVNRCPLPHGTVCWGCGTQGVIGEDCPFCDPHKFSLEPPQWYLSRLQPRRAKYYKKKS
ncbi:uncharacterized protein [Fopius arisanus]|uniref:Ea_3 protein n=1 Tax=Fopius arisanus TaxID=64838 RepID=A0A0C9REQ6_9HYME|nr:PREDICTED: uncharacterized protein LOC105272919 [Fopius arisanus]